MRSGGTIAVNRRDCQEKARKGVKVLIEALGLLTSTRLTGTVIASSRTIEGGPQAPALYAFSSLVTDRLLAGSGT